MPQFICYFQCWSTFRHLSHLSFFFHLPPVSNSMSISPCLSLSVSTGYVFNPCTYTCVSICQPAPGLVLPQTGVPNSRADPVCPSSFSLSCALLNYFFVSFRAKSFLFLCCSLCSSLAAYLICLLCRFWYLSSCASMVSSCLVCSPCGGLIRLDTI